MYEMPKIPVNTDRMRKGELSCQLGLHLRTCSRAYSHKHFREPEAEGHLSRRK